jgi:hypothetical protein
MRRLIAITSLTAALVMSAPASAAGPTKDQCIQAFDAGQSARRAGHLKDAHEALVTCSQSTCPTVLRADCSDVLRQVDAAQPSVVFGAVDAKGNDLVDVSVELEGKDVATSLDGRAFIIDPGKLTFTFKRPPWDPVKVDVVIKEGEKSRVVKAKLGPEAAPPVAIQPVPPPVSEAPKRDTVGYVVPGAFAALGLAAFAFGGITRLGAGSDADDAKKSCGPYCPESQRADLSGELVRANIGLGVGIGALAVAAATWFILGPRK